MNQADQGVSPHRYATIPRTLVFILHQDRMLLLRGAPHKPRWANKLNGIGGHIEPGEDPWTAAQREVAEETGLHVDDLRLVALVHISGRAGRPGVMLFVFLAHALSPEVRSSPEGEVAWYPLASLPWADMVADLAALLPRVLATCEAAPDRADCIVYGLYTPDDQGHLQFSFRCSS